jgi:hypothetical protein
VGTGRDINYLPLLQNEYAREKVWVDVGTTGEWVVYEKSNNYKDTAFSKVNQGVTFGYSSVYIPALGYFIADPGNNVIHHYKKYGNQYFTVADINPPAGITPTTFGISIVKSNQFMIVADSNPDSISGTSYLYVYKILNENLLQTVVLDQVIDFPGAGRFGDVVTISEDGNFIYATLLDYGTVITFVLDPQLMYEAIIDNIDHVSMTLSSNTELQTNYFTVDGDWATENAHKTILQGKSVTFSNDDPISLLNAKTYTILSVRYNSLTHKTTFYTVEQFEEVYSSGTAVLTASYNFTSWNTPADNEQAVELLGYTSTSAAEGYGLCLATNKSLANTYNGVLEW